jgi:hypothetical protein
MMITPPPAVCLVLCCFLTSCAYEEDCNRDDIERDIARNMALAEGQQTVCDQIAASLPEVIKQVQAKGICRPSESKWKPTGTQ